MTQDPNRDRLTKLWKREYAFGELEKMVENGAQVALISIDIDYLRCLNDGFGLNYGDAAIAEIAREIEAASGEDALVFRVGRDEFGVILQEYSLERARELAEKIRANCRPTPLQTYDGREVMALTLSLGIAHFPTQVSSWETLLAAADLALLKAKRGGCLSDGTPYTARNRVMAIGDFSHENESHSN